MEGATIRADYLQEEVRRQYKSSAVSGKDRTETYAVDGAAQGNLARTIFAKPRHSVGIFFSKYRATKPAARGSVKITVNHAFVTAEDR
jgi:hypothetical protein